MKQILLPTDFSENSWNAILYGIALFKKTQCTFYILHVNPIPSYSAAGSSVRVSQETLKKTILRESGGNLQKLLKRIEGLPLNTKHTFITSTVYDYFSDAIKKEVKSKNIDLIIMGTKGASGLKKATMGSNTGAVITKVDCPLLAVPENATYVKPREIAFATDFQIVYNSKMLETLKKIASLNNSVLRILYISKKDEVLSSEQNENKKFLIDHLGDLEHSLHSLTNTKLHMAVQCFSESRDIDMIAMVAKDQNFFKRILFRPEVKEVSYHTDIPFLVLHE